MQPMMQLHYATLLTKVSMYNLQGNEQEDDGGAS